MLRFVEFSFAQRAVQLLRTIKTKVSSWLFGVALALGSSKLKSNDHGPNIYHRYPSGSLDSDEGRCVSFNGPASPLLFYSSDG